MKATIEQLEYCINEMRRLQVEHPKATIYYDWENSEIRITYPLPKDFQIFKTTSDSFNEL